MGCSDMAFARTLAPLAAICACALALTACGGSKAKATTSTGTTATQGTGTSGSSTQSTGAQGTPAGEAAASREASAHEVVASSGSLAATLSVTGGHHPRVGEHWPITFTVKQAGRPATAEVSYEYLFGGAVVAHRSHYHFTGAFHDVFTWPASAVGYPLTFRAVIMSSRRTLNLDYPVQVVR